jgi:hypothetical protein
MFRKSALLFIFSVTLIVCVGVCVTFGQPGSGQSPTAPKETGGKPNNPNSGSGKSGGGKSQPSKPASPVGCAEESVLLVRCGLPECEVTVDTQPQGVTNTSGELRISVTQGNRKIIVSKNGYESANATANVPCGEIKTAEIKLKPKPFDLVLKTNLPDCEIFINDSQTPIGKSDEKGYFKYRVETGNVLVQAKKTGYVADSVNVTPTTAQKEVLLKLKPMPARITLTANITGAVARADKEEKTYDASETFSLEPGQHTLVISALGYAPLTLELDLKPNQIVLRAVTLNRLSVAELLNQAEQFYKKKSPVETLKLCKYVFEVEPNNAVANRIAGTVYLDRQDYATAESYLMKALAGNETVVLKIRRHYNEKFELSSGHDACVGELRLNKNEIEYRGLTVTAENFKVPYSQVQIIGQQIKKNVALCLSLKIADEKGKKKDYNFFSVDKELSQEGKIYLNMIQRLIQTR